MKTGGTMAGQILIWSGVVLAAIGATVILVSALAVRGARGQGDAVLRARMARILPWNMGGLGVAVIGLLCVIVGLAIR